MKWQEKRTTDLMIYLRKRRALSAAILANAIIIILSVLYGLFHQDLLFAFNEKGFATQFSGLQLLGCSLVSLLHFLRVLSRRKGNMFDALFWLTLAVGFIYLSLDEIFMYHEKLDKYIHSVLAIKETPWSDRIDDLLVGIYVGIASGLIALSAKLKSFHLETKKIFAKALLIAAIMVLFDVITNGPELLNWLLGSMGNHVKLLLSIAEECLKLVSGGLLLGGLILNAQLLGKSLRDN